MSHDHASMCPVGLILFYFTQQFIWKATAVLADGLTACARPPEITYIACQVERSLSRLKWTLLRAPPLRLSPSLMPSKHVSAVAVVVNDDTTLAHQTRNFNGEW